MKILASFSVLLILSACSTGHSKKEIPTYFYAQQGQPIELPNQASSTPNIDKTWVVPKAAAPLSEYHPELIEPPNLIEPKE